VAFDASADRNNQLFVFRIGERSATQVGSVPSGAFSPDWSPVGDLLIFSSYTADGNPQLFTMPAGGGESTQLTTTQVFKAFPRWSRDASTVAYVGTILVPTAAEYEPGSLAALAGSGLGRGFTVDARLHNVGVYTSAADGSNETLVTDLTQDAWLLGWCAAGPWITSGWTQQ
jgi:Tol biopolymer transport system component